MTLLKKNKTLGYPPKSIKEILYILYSMRKNTNNCSVKFQEQNVICQ